MRRLAGAGLVVIQRLPGRGLEVTLNDAPAADAATRTERKRNRA
jgi:hypothetical protein